MASSSSQRRCVFVGNIPYDATEEQLVQICEEVGPVVSFRLVLDRETGKPKGYGFCEYKDEETALSARRNLHGYEINGRQLRVDFAENDKSADRGREQGRGGPGLASSSGAPSILGDSSLHQPIGLQIAGNAAATMAKALGEASQSPPGADLLTQHLAKMSRHQLSQIMIEMKALATQNGPLARQLLQTSLQLPKALFQAQIILNMATPQMLQMPNLRQPGPSPSQDSVEVQKGMTPSFHNQPPLQSLIQTGILAKLPEGQSPLIRGQAQVQQGHHVSQGLILSGAQAAFSQPLSGLTVAPRTSALTARGLLQQDRPAVPSNVIIQQPLSGRLPSSQQQRIPSTHIPGEHGGYSASLSHNSGWGPQAHADDHLPKRLKLEGISGASHAPAASDKQAPQLPNEMQRVLLEQVKSLTPEQLSLLPPDQRQQVIDLQRRLRMLEGLDAAT